jgi:DNA-binding NtrC family response regulator
MIRLLFIDDDPQAQKTLALVLQEGYVVISALNAAEGLEVLQGADPEVVLLDIDLPDRSGLDVLDEILSRPVPPAVIMLTAYGEVEFVKRAIRAGAYDYILKPYVLEQLEGTIRRAVQNLALRKAYVARPDSQALGELIGESRPLKELKSLAVRYAAADSPVLIQGESGTGKELVAQALHSLSHRREQKFLALNCGAIPETLLESELFGSERGAYTDATTRAGCFERANGGTVFLDEIGEMPLKAQVSLLRVLERKELYRVGGSQAIPLNIRILSATNRDLRLEVESGRFREDLFYRINVLFLSVPPLRERIEDISLLAAYFLRQQTRPGLRLHPQVIDKLLEHSWPGNVRELRNVIERAAVLSDGEEIRARDILFA